MATARFKLTASDYAAMADMSAADRRLYLDTQVYPRSYNEKLGLTRAALNFHAEINFQNSYQAWRDDFLAMPAESYVPARAA